MNETETQIFQVVSDLKLDSGLKKAGDFIQAEVGSFADLVDLGVLRLIEGAKNVDEAVQHVKDEIDAKVQETELEAEMKPKNTWEAAKPEADAAPTEEKPVVAADAGAADANAPVNAEDAPVDAPVLSKYTVLKEGGISIANPDDAEAPIEVGQGVEVDLVAADPATVAFLADGSIEPLVVKAPDEETGDDL